MSLRRTLNALVDSGRQVIVFGQVPTPKLDPIRCIARARFNNQDESLCATMLIEDRAETEALVTQALRTAAQDNPKIQIVLPYKHLCGMNGCPIVANHRLLFMDAVHLSSAGAPLAAIDLETNIASALAMTEAKKPRE
jgi:hypothetical protein